MRKEAKIQQGKRAGGSRGITPAKRASGSLLQASRRSHLCCRQHLKDGAAVKWAGAVAGQYGRGRGLSLDTLNSRCLPAIRSVFQEAAGSGVGGCRQRASMAEAQGLQSEAGGAVNKGTSQTD